MEDTKTRLLKQNGELEADVNAREFDLNKQITDLKEDLAEEKKHTKEW